MRDPTRETVDAALKRRIALDSYTSNAIKTLLQILAVAGMIGIVTMILHKGYADISALARQNSGDEFWRALAQYLIRNLGGGS